MTKKASLRPTTVTYTNAISVCRRANPPDAEMAILLLKNAKDQGVKINVFMYSAAIWTAERLGDWEMSLNLFNEMKRNPSSQPNTVSYDGGKLAAVFLISRLKAYRDLTRKPSCFSYFIIGKTWPY